MRLRTCTLLKHDKKFLNSLVKFFRIVQKGEYISTERDEIEHDNYENTYSHYVCVAQTRQIAVDESGSK